MKILSSFTHSRVFPNLYECVCSALFPHSSEYLPLCSAEQTHSYRFGNTREWVNDDRIVIFGWTVPLRKTFAFIRAVNKYTPVKPVLGFIFYFYAFSRRFYPKRQAIHFYEYSYLYFWRIKGHLRLLSSFICTVPRCYLRDTAELRCDVYAVPVFCSWFWGSTSSTQSAGNQPVRPFTVPSQNPPSPTLNTESVRQL